VESGVSTFTFSNLDLAKDLDINNQRPTERIWRQAPLCRRLVCARLSFAYLEWSTGNKHEATRRCDTLWENESRDAALWVDPMVRLGVGHFTILPTSILERLGRSQNQHLHSTSISSSIVRRKIPGISSRTFLVQDTTKAVPLTATPVVIDCHDVGSRFKYCQHEYSHHIGAKSP
jgi:hypothetical protein